MAGYQRKVHEAGVASNQFGNANFELTCTHDT
jgi:hypothetical protein